jgi:hypothetical protein
VIIAKQFGEKDKRQDKQPQQEGNLGHKEAQLEKEKQAELSHMSESSPKAKRKDERHSG